MLYSRNGTVRKYSAAPFQGASENRVLWARIFILDIEKNFSAEELELVRQISEESEPGET